MKALLSFLLILPFACLAPTIGQTPAYRGAAAIQGRPVSGGAWSPLSVSGLLGWYKADSEGYSDTSNATTFHDRSGNGNDFTTSISVPTMATNFKNGLAAIKFGTSQGYDTCGMLSSTKPFTVWAVIRTQDNAGNQCTIFGSSGGSALQWRIENDNHQRALSQGTAGIGVSTSVVGWLTWSIVAMTYDGVGNYAFYLNGSSDGTGTANFTFTSHTSTLGTAGGGEFFGSSTGAAYIGEVGKYDSVLSGGDLASLFTYLNGRWAVY